MKLISNYQYNILSTLKSGGKLLSWYEKTGNGDTEGWVYRLDDKQGNTLSVRRDSVKKLHNLNFLLTQHNCPAMGITRYFITVLGKEWVNTN